MAKEFDLQVLKTKADSVDSQHKALDLLKAMARDVSVEEAVIRHARRELAIYKDRARKLSKAPAQHAYTPDLSRVDEPKVLNAVASYLDDVASTYRRPVDGEAAPKVRKAVKAAPKVRKAVKADTLKALEAQAAELLNTGKV